MTPHERRDHVLDWAGELGVIIVVDEDELKDMYDDEDCTVTDPCGYAYGRSRPFTGAPFMPPVIVLSHDPGKTAATYLVALHELGHIATAKESRQTLEREALAWLWALKHSEEDSTSEEWRFLAMSLGSYKGCRRCKPSTRFTRLLRKAERRSRVV